MPTYVYKCERCGDEYEKTLPMKDRYLPTLGWCIAPVPDVAGNPVECQGKINLIPARFTFSMKGST